MFDDDAIKNDKTPFHPPPEDEGWVTITVCLHTFRTVIIHQNIFFYAMII